MHGNFTWQHWWCVRWGRRIVMVEEANDAASAIGISIEALRGMGDWTDDPAELVAFPQAEAAQHAKPHDFTRAIIARDWRERLP